MGIIYETIQRPNLFDYEREWNEDGTEKHICCDGARYHVLSYSFGRDGTAVRCSEPRCEINKCTKPSK
jgi:hypothetical protein